MFMPSYPYFVKKRRKKRKSCWQDKAYFSTRGNEIQIKTIIHLVLIKRQQNARIISEVWSWLGGMLCHHHTSAGFPSSFPSMPNDVSSLAFCCSASRAALPAALPAWVAAAGAAGSTSPTTQNKTSSHSSAWAVCLISRNTPSWDAKQSKHNPNTVTTPGV